MIKLDTAVSTLNLFQEYLLLIIIYKGQGYGRGIKRML